MHTDEKLFRNEKRPSDIEAASFVGLDCESVGNVVGRKAFIRAPSACLSRNPFPANGNV